MTTLTQKILSMLYGIATGMLVMTITGVAPRAEAQEVTYQVVQFNGTVADAIASDTRFSNLVNAFQATGQVGSLQGTAPVTVYAPTNEAFAKIPPAILQSALDPINRTSLMSVLAYHATPGSVDILSFRGTRVFGTLAGQWVYITRNRSTIPTINNSNISTRIIKANNGYVYAIDSIMVPQFK